MQNNYIFILVIWFYCCGNAQQKNFKFPDSLSSKSYKYFSDKISYNDRNSIREQLYAQSWLAKAKSEKNFSQMAQAYKTFIYLFDKKLRLIYADSAITAAKQTEEIELIGSSYMTKGIVQYDRNEQMKALDNYIIANQYISHTNNQYLIYKVKYGIALTKYYLGYYNEAIALFKECVVYFKEENERAYLNSLHSLGLCYNKIGNYQLSGQTNQIGQNAGQLFKITEMEPYFILSEGINQYCLHNYNDAEKKLKAALTAIEKNKDFTNETIAYFYIGKTYWAQNQKEKALPYFKKVDEAFQKQNYIRPDLIEAYALILDYYVKKKDKEAQLHYTSKLLKVDRVMNSHYKYLIRKIFKEYDAKKLILANQDIENAAVLIISILALIIIILVYRRHKNKRLFDELMNRQPEAAIPFIVDENKKTGGNRSPEETAVPASSGNKVTELDISSEVVLGILIKLEKFENSKKYLEKEMSLIKLASLLSTNTKYVSKIIMKYRNKGTIEYVSDLKIDHIVELLKTEKKFRQYTNKALGVEVGFGSTQNFTRAFNNRTGISPSYFIKELNKSI
ncbi:AraC family transcriptional regulator [Flavobacterium sp. 5]|uniref:AraC family transcriptional regulator n=1 Tax=Flavobacterium sp. 5 TaxID=2035199 RepID=UPI000C2BEC82|nr:AraC family transcriptional regulator [Flavobacterium sp. 5]PKB18060.1 tetratricopeptide repeat protein [Flavobacterium sp. 5]